MFCYVMQQRYDHGAFVVVVIVTIIKYLSTVVRLLGAFSAAFVYDRVPGPGFATETCLQGPAHRQCPEA